ncbi:hypothetical protein C8F04DRAFT_1234560 [Mycena alexandri]|uniref:Uncharacterized protein n=1 Tax=Mycena alexandri TaxID=1745969 RepID=A0AAD6WWE4_9AGAR|nr:hypothetical protein C8F04DRAFT_1238881 [Mycena alexandri]KAJ7033907.1 hypothetical protein C8F04DRAFT_1234560 [Mycena alexandri]
MTERTYLEIRKLRNLCRESPVGAVMLAGQIELGLACMGPKDIERTETRNSQVRIDRKCVLSAGPTLKGAYWEFVTERTYVEIRNSNARNRVPRNTTARHYKRNKRGEPAKMDLLRVKNDEVLLALTMEHAGNISTERGAAELHAATFGRRNFEPQKHEDELWTNLEIDENRIDEWKYRWRQEKESIWGELRRPGLVEGRTRQTRENGRGVAEGEDTTKKEQVKAAAETAGLYSRMGDHNYENPSRREMQGLNVDDGLEWRRDNLVDMGTRFGAGGVPHAQRCGRKQADLLKAMVKLGTKEQAGSTYGVGVHEMYEVRDGPGLWKRTNTQLWMSYIGLSILAAMPNPSNPLCAPFLAENPRIAYFLVGGFLRGWFGPKTGLERAYGGEKWFEFELGAEGAGNRQKESGIG